MKTIKDLVKTETEFLEEKECEKNKNVISNIKIFHDNGTQRNTITKG